jgi:hypothetical protein
MSGLMAPGSSPTRMQFFFPIDFTGFRRRDSRTLAIEKVGFD